MISPLSNIKPHLFTSHPLIQGSCVFQLYPSHWVFTVFGGTCGNASTSWPESGSPLPQDLWPVLISSPAGYLHSFPRPPHFLPSFWPWLTRHFFLEVSLDCASRARESLLWASTAPRTSSSASLYSTVFVAFLDVSCPQKQYSLWGQGLIVSVLKQYFRVCHRA